MLLDQCRICGPRGMLELSSDDGDFVEAVARAGTFHLVSQSRDRGKVACLEQDSDTLEIFSPVLDVVRDEIGDLRVYINGLFQLATGGTDSSAFPAATSAEISSRAADTPGKFRLAASVSRRIPANPMDL